MIKVVWSGMCVGLQGLPCHLQMSPSKVASNIFFWWLFKIWQYHPKLLLFSVKQEVLLRIGYKYLMSRGGPVLGCPNSQHLVGLNTFFRTVTLSLNYIRPFAPYDLSSYAIKKSYHLIFFILLNDLARFDVIKPWQMVENVLSEIIATNVEV